ncbi:hypothetical protein WMY93_011758 [Mugilogobius chulae]|uniref:Uncharacterized protein n=1 Tax=Mugilogobius chulae TaxID=88201 RepID=A0AAW0PCF5_9GOBI
MIHYVAKPLEELLPAPGGDKRDGQRRQILLSQEEMRVTESEWTMFSVSSVTTAALNDAVRLSGSRQSGAAREKQQKTGQLYPQVCASPHGALKYTRHPVSLRPCVVRRGSAWLSCVAALRGPRAWLCSSASLSTIIALKWSG